MDSLNHLFLFHNGKDIRAYEFYGCHKLNDGNFVFRVWAPHALKVSIIGTFNGWNEKKDYLRKLQDNESFEIILSNVTEGDRYKFCIYTCDDRKIIKSDPYATRSELPKSDKSIVYCKEVSPLPINEAFSLSDPINIYEVNLLSWKKHKNGSYYSYKELTRSLVPYVKNMGYTHVEFMPITEYPFDGSWGYQVTGYFSVLSRLGSPNDFAELINAFHKNGIKVILDWVPAHFPKDDFGLIEFDGQPLYEDDRAEQMEFKKWGTRKFNFSKKEVQSFLLSSANYFIEEFAIDGIRLDAVASMLYLDYDKDANEWTPNRFGDNRDLKAIEFLKEFNSTIKSAHPNVLLIAEDSSTFDGVTKSVENDGLGFDFKWNLGWMNDTLFYCRQDPYFRSYHHNCITFSMVYSLNENYILPLSHDEVVHVKGSIINKMPCSYEDKFAGERLLLGYMFAHPGKKLNFMGYEVAQFDEWHYESAIQFDLKKFAPHQKMSKYVKSLNNFYSNNSELYEIDNDWKGFEWLVVDDNQNNVLIFNRFDGSKNCITCICNFSGVDLKKYVFGQEEGIYNVVFNSDDTKYGGRGAMKKRIIKTRNKPSHNKDHSIRIDIPKLTCLYLKKRK